jgi:hypothetical protein
VSLACICLHFVDDVRVWTIVEWIFKLGGLPKGGFNLIQKNLTRIKICLGGAIS